MGRHDHVHDCTGPAMTCQCGFVFQVMPISVSIEVFDVGRPLVNDAFSCDRLDGAIAALRRAILRLEQEKGGEK
jgi:hypothetical protein